MININQVQAQKGHKKYKEIWVMREGVGREREWQIEIYMYSQGLSALWSSGMGYRLTTYEIFKETKDGITKNSKQ